ncbi:hypothetical protein ACFYWS_28560 [Streptomyces sp. NPDC002795]|uniref:hypothetical protein n=1 Tax=Streptomyces sp. NPDC002795 TaxID=3364665 RepID=UPI003691B525
MTGLPEISTDLATYFSMAANTLGAAMVASAAQRITDGSIEAGRGYFRRLFRREDGRETSLVLTGDRSEQRADQLLGSLSAEDRARLADALTTWVCERRHEGGLDEGRLAQLLAAPAAAPTYNVTSHGAHSAAIGQVGPNATFNLGGDGHRGGPA